MNGLDGFFMAPATYRLALATDRARATPSLEFPMVFLVTPNLDLTYEFHRARSERMERKRAKNSRQQAFLIAPIPRHMVDSIL